MHICTQHHHDHHHSHPPWITYTSHGNGIQGYAHNLAGYTDSDFARDTNDQKSTSGWVFTYNGAPISWASKKQGLVTRSSIEAELVAGSIASAEGIWLISLGNNFQHKFTPIPLFTDNQSFIALSNNNMSSLRTKHIDIHHHYTRDPVLTGDIKLHYIVTFGNPADILTKALSPHKHVYLLDALGVKQAWRGVLLYLDYYPKNTLKTL